MNQVIVPLEKKYGVPWYIHPYILPILIAIVLAVATTAFSWGMFYYSVKSDMKVISDNQSEMKKGIESIQASLKIHEVETVKNITIESTWHERIVALEKQIEFVFRNP